MSSQENLVIIGYESCLTLLKCNKWLTLLLSGGIIGLNVALVLAKEGLGRHITVVAEYLPGDTSAHYTSPW